MRTAMDLEATNLVNVAHRLTSATPFEDERYEAEWRRLVLSEAIERLEAAKERLVALAHPVAAR